ncbi:hypothetical protein Mapa_016012 [Marchantia paleacea]|nr:hypothetical protein Mapa_016012 [Marchantia paleacea]
MQWLQNESIYSTGKELTCRSFQCGSSTRNVRSPFHQQRGLVETTAQVAGKIYAETCWNLAASQNTLSVKLWYGEVQWFTLLDTPMPRVQPIFLLVTLQTNLKT